MQNCSQPRLSLTCPNKQQKHTSKAAKQIYLNFYQFIHLYMDDIIKINSF